MYYDTAVLNSILIWLFQSLFFNILIEELISDVWLRIPRI